MAAASVDTNWLDRPGIDDVAREPSRLDDAADLWPCEERALVAWEAHRVRRWVVRGVGVACMAVLAVVLVRVGTSAAARGEIMAWVTMGKVAQPRATAVEEAPDHSAVGAEEERGAAPAEIAPAAPFVAAPAVAAPAAPKAGVVATPTRAPRRVASPLSVSATDDPYAPPDKAVTPRGENVDVADPYR